MRFLNKILYTRKEILELQGEKPTRSHLYSNTSLFPRQEYSTHGKDLFKK